MKRTAEEHLGFRRRVPSEDIEGLQYTISLLRGILADNIAHKAPFMENRILPASPYRIKEPKEAFTEI